MFELVAVGESQEHGWVTICMVYNMLQRFQSSTSEKGRHSELLVHQV